MNPYIEEKRGVVMEYLKAFITRTWVDCVLKNVEKKNALGKIPANLMVNFSEYPINLFCVLKILFIFFRERHQSFPKENEQDFQYTLVFNF